MNRVLKNEMRPSKRFPERSNNRSEERSAERFPERLHNRSRELSLVDHCGSNLKFAGSAHAWILHAPRACARIVYIALAYAHVRENIRAKDRKSGRGTQTTPPPPQ